MAVVLAENNGTLLFELACVPAVRLALTVVLLATYNVENTIRGSRPGAVTFAVVSGTVESFCGLVPLSIELTLEIPAEPLAVSDELNIRPSSRR